MEGFIPTEEPKVVRDPIHGYIHINLQIIWDLLKTREVQRLRRITQLGGNHQVYHCAEHSRFPHSLGVYEIVCRMCTEVEDISSSLSDFEKVQVMCAALLHDVGHGPYSHFFEQISGKDHESVSMEIILDPKSEVNQVLIQANPELPEKIAAILSHKHENLLLCDCISSQLDADRMDYLLRDAYMSGTSYGKFDLERILRTMRVKHGRLCVKESGMHSVEDYIMARYHMYWQVYLHPDASSYEILILHFFRRLLETRDPSCSDIFSSLWNLPLSLDAFYAFDEHMLFYGISKALESSDPILKDLARRILNRDFFECMENPSPEAEEEIKKQLAMQGFDPKWYYAQHVWAVHDMLPYMEDEKNQAILISLPDGSVKPLSACSHIAAALLKMDALAIKRIYYPKQLKLKKDGLAATC